MRKLKRGIIRATGEKLHAKPSKYLHDTWEAIQIKKHGKVDRAKNVAKAAKRRSTWGIRIAAAVAGLK